MEEHLSISPEQTRALGIRLAERAAPGTIFALYGDLGAGKTCLVQGLAAGLEITEVVNSPTYTLVNEYQGTLPLIHVDLYRVTGTGEALGLGLEEYFEGEGVVALEWAERASDLLPEKTLHVVIRSGASPNERVIHLGTSPPDAP